MKDRIYQLMQHTGLNQAEFAERLGMSAGSVSNIFTGRTNPTNNHVQAIHRAFPQVNVNWLLFGEGEMMNDADASSSAEDTDGTGVQSPTSAAPSPATLSANTVAPPAHAVAAAAHASLMAQAMAAARQPLPEEMPVPAPVVVRRQVKEIRVFYDDGTYESFSPLKV